MPWHDSLSQLGVRSRFSVPLFCVFRDCTLPPPFIVWSIRLHIRQIFVFVLQCKSAVSKTCPYPHIYLLSKSGTEKPCLETLYSRCHFRVPPDLFFFLSGIFPFWFHFRQCIFVFLQAFDAPPRLALIVFCASAYSWDGIFLLP
jgi:hypothetical protein